MIIIPTHAWDLMLDSFETISANVERVAYFDGVAIAEAGIVTTVTIPNALLYERYFEVSADAMSEAGKHLRANRIVRLAQVHTHPGARTDHSIWDDEKAYSQIPGAISIVLSHHARFRPQLHDAGIHLRTQDEWRRLRPDEVDAYIKVVPSFFDFRK